MPWKKTEGKPPLDNSECTLVTATGTHVFGRVPLIGLPFHNRKSVFRARALEKQSCLTCGRTGSRLGHVYCRNCLGLVNTAATPRLSPSLARITTLGRGWCQLFLSPQPRRGHFIYFSFHPSRWCNIDAYFQYGSTYTCSQSDNFMCLAVALFLSLCTVWYLCTESWKLKRDGFDGST